MQFHNHPTWTSMAILGALTLMVQTALVCGQATLPPTFTNPLDIDNAFHPFPASGTVILKEFGVRQGHTDLEVIDTYATTTRSFPWSGQAVECRTLIEEEWEEGELIEISFNYFAQADDGTVYYFGETVDIYEGGVLVSHDGSWLVGGPLAGDPPGTVTATDPAVFMPDDPDVGDTWKPEDLLPFGIDETAECLKTGRTVVTPAGQFDGCIKVLESSALHDDTELKWYAPGIGVIKVKEQAEHLLLLSIEAL